MRALSLARAGTLAAVAVVLTACGTSATSPTSSGAAAAAVSPAPVSSPPASIPGLAPGAVLVEDYLPGLASQVRVPAAEGPAPLVVLVPGGGWSSADPTGFEPLAESLTAAGATTSLITYSTTAMGAAFPQPVDDVMCAVRWSAATATALGRPPTRVVVVGHSAGGHLATLVALSGDEFGGRCQSPEVPIDGAVGLAGVYDTTWSIGALDQFFAGTESADGRAKGSPLVWAQQAVAIPTGLRVLLIHGDADDSVPVDQTTVLADALRETDVDLTVAILPGEDHVTVIDADIVGPIIEEWLTAVP